KRDLATTIDEKAIEERARDRETANFERFREEWLSRGPNAPFHDPAPKVLDLLSLRTRVETASRDAEFLDQWVRTLSELISGEASGLRQVDLDRAGNSLEHARNAANVERARYRDALDALKPSLGLTPRAAVVPDLSILRGFVTVFQEADDWHFKPNRRFDALPTIAMRLPRLGEVKVGERVLNDLMTGDDDLAWEAAVAEVAARADDTQAEITLRKRLRNLGVIARSYVSERRRFVLNMRLVSDTYELVIAPPAVSTNLGASGGRESEDLMAAKRRERTCRERLVTLWLAFQKEKLEVWRALGILPVDDWQAFRATLTAEASDPPSKPPADAKPDAPPEPQVPAPAPPAPARPGRSGD
ncbi:MAG: hypothetical protein AB7I30_10195, partial [Isosphaeraceae bacterium]